MLTYCMLRLPWRVHRQLSIIAATLPHADEMSEAGRAEALEYAVGVALERLRQEGKVSADDEAYMQKEAPRERAGLVGD